VTSVAVEPIEGIDLDHTPPCDAEINGLRCLAESSYRITFSCCGARSVFLCKTCYLIVQVHPHPACLYCDQVVTDWRTA
jgi:hypothetical protein